MKIEGEGKEEEEDFVFTRDSIAEEDPPNAHQAQHRRNARFDECEASLPPYTTAVLETSPISQGPHRLVQISKRRKGKTGNNCSRTLYYNHNLQVLVIESRCSGLDSSSSL